MVKKCRDTEASRNGLLTVLYRYSPKDTAKTVTTFTRESWYHNQDSKWVLSILKSTSLQSRQLARSVYRLEGMLNMNLSNHEVCHPRCVL